MTKLIDAVTTAQKETKEKNPLVRDVLKIEIEVERPLNFNGDSEPIFLETEEAIHAHLENIWLGNYVDQGHLKTTKNKKFVFTAESSNNCFADAWKRPFQEADKQFRTRISGSLTTKRGGI
tara:strand:+ start:634 stop:996 length:363 start_codon:yes stop_codon:yes gene_type:complete